MCPRQFGMRIQPQSASRQVAGEPVLTSPAPHGKAVFPAYHLELIDCCPTLLSSPQSRALDTSYAPATLASQIRQPAVWATKISTPLPGARVLRPQSSQG